MYTFQAFLLCFISIFHFLIYSAILTLLYNVHLPYFFTLLTVQYILIRYSIRTLNCIVETVVHYISVCGLHLHVGRKQKKSKEEESTQDKKL